MSPFDILNKDFDDFALIVNYFLEDQDEKEARPKQDHASKDKRIRVNDKTATGGWF